MTVRDTQRFSGAFPALPTPFDQDGQLCTEPLRTLVRDLILQGVEGFYALGSTGESLLLSVEERKTALEAVVAEAKTIEPTRPSHDLFGEMDGQSLCRPIVTPNAKPPVSENFATAIRKKSV